MLQILIEKNDAFVSFFAKRENGDSKKTSIKISGKTASAVTFCNK